MAEDLGEILFSTGKIEREALDRARALSKGRSTLGRVLVEGGLVSPKDLWLTVRTQVEGIVYQLFSAEEGSFCFRSKALEKEQIIRLSMSTQNLIMEGLRRQDEGALFMRRILSLDHFPRGTEKAAEELSAEEQSFYESARSGRVCARDLFRKNGLREFDGMRILHGLLEQRLLKMEEEAVAEVGGDLGQILTIYNSVLKAISARMVKAQPDFLSEVQGCLRALPQPYSFVLRDAELLEDGSLDGHRIAQNLAGLEEGDKKKLMAEALGRLVDEEAELLQEGIDADQTQPLVQRIQDISSRVKALIGS